MHGGEIEAQVLAKLLHCRLAVHTAEACPLLPKPESTVRPASANLESLLVLPDEMPSSEGSILPETIVLLV